MKRKKTQTMTEERDNWTKAIELKDQLTQWWRKADGRTDWRINDGQWRRPMTNEPGRQPDEANQWQPDQTRQPDEDSWRRPNWRPSDGQPIDDGKLADDDPANDNDRRTIIIISVKPDDETMANINDDNEIGQWPDGRTKPTDEGNDGPTQPRPIGQWMTEEANDSDQAKLTRQIEKWRKTEKTRR